MLSNIIESFAFQLDLICANQFSIYVYGNVIDASPIKPTGNEVSKLRKIPEIIDFPMTMFTRIIVFGNRLFAKISKVLTFKKITLTSNYDRKINQVSEKTNVGQDECAD